MGRTSRVSDFKFQVSSNHQHPTPITQHPSPITQHPTTITQHLTTYRENPRCWGTYIHGILDNPPVIDELLNPLLKDKEKKTSFDYQAYKQQQYDLLADAVRREIDMPTLYRILRGA